jgi:hypothetical protein
MWSQAILTLALLVISLGSIQAAERQCDAAAGSGGTCGSSGTCPSEVCLPAINADQSSSTSLYRFGGTAQAYKEHGTSTKTSICEVNNTMKKPYRVATWPYRRASYSGHKVPHIFLNVSVLTCGQSSKPSSCCCEAWTAKDEVTVQVWQTQPDGTYGSLQPGVEDGLCRAQQHSVTGRLEFETLPPGSYGSLGGLGPNGWDFMPYGQPVIHFLVSSPAGYASTLVDVPIYFDTTTLEQKSFRYFDWRGPAWTRQQTEKTGYEIVSWQADPKRRSITIHVNLFLQKLSTTTSSSSSGDGDISPKEETSFCESTVYGLPSSFFHEPITVCGSSLLDFFRL